MTLDLAIMALYFLVVLCVGLYMSRKVKTAADYTTGNRSYSSLFIFATLTAAYMGGGFTSGLSEKVFSIGIIYIIALWGFSIKEILIATLIAPRMTAFKDATSVGDIMGRLYGQNAKILTGTASAFVCAGIAAAQFGAFGYIVHVLTGISPVLGAILAAVVVIAYSSLGGMKSVVANDFLHFWVLIIALPMVVIFGVNHIGGWESLMSQVPQSNIKLFDKIGILAACGMFLNFFFGETLVPPYVQRLLIGKTLKETARGTLWSGLLSIFLFPVIGCIGLIALVMNPEMNANLALPYVIDHVMPIGFRGLAISGMVAVIMSSADAFLNAAGTAITQDIIKPLRSKSLTGKTELRVSRLSSLCVGITAVLFSISFDSVLETLLYAYNFWTPFILVPLVAGIWGYRASAKTFWVGALVGISSVIIWNTVPHNITIIDGAIVGIFTNFLTFTLMLRAEGVPKTTLSKVNPTIEV